MFKKILIILLVFSIILGLFNFIPAMADEEDDELIKAMTSVTEKAQEQDGFEVENYEFNDVAGTVYEKPVKLLSIIGLVNGYEDGSFKPSNSITRAEIAEVVIKMLGISNGMLILEGESFKDVTDTYWARNSIEIGQKLEIINGDSLGNFNPDNNVTYEQAIKILVCALGYGIQADAKGGYPIGHLIMARELKITEDVDVKIGRNISRGELSQLVYNSLQVEVSELKSYGVDSKISFKKGESLLKQRFDVYKSVGEVKGTHITQYVEEISIRENEIKIDNKAFDVNEHDNKYSSSKSASSLFGYKVEYFYKQSGNSKPVLMYIEKFEDENHEFSVSDEKIIEFNKTSLKYELEDDEKNKNKEDNEILEIKEGAIYIVNGIYDPEFNPEIEPVLSGSVRVVDNNDDGIYDIVFVNNYDILIVGQVLYRDTLELRTIIREKRFDVIDKYDQSKRYHFDLEEKNNKVVFYKNNEEVEFEDIEIKSDDILSIMSSKDGKLTTIYIANSNVIGKVSEIGDEKKIILDEGEFALSKFYTDSSYITKQYVTVGDRVILFMNHESKVVDIVPVKNSLNYYGYFIEYAKKSGLGNKHQFKIFTSWGEHWIYEADDKLTIDGMSVNSNDINAILSNPQLIKFKANGKLKITEIYTANGTNDDFALRRQYLTNNPMDELNGYGVKVIKQGSNYRIRFLNNALSNYYLSSNTRVFTIPNDKTRDEFYELTNGDYVSSNPNINGPYYIELYDLDNDGIAKIAIINMNEPPKYATDVPTANGVMFIDKTTLGLDNSGNEILRIYGYSAGVKTIVNTDDLSLGAVDPNGVWGTAGISVKSLKSGDVIQAGYDPKGRMYAYKLMYRKSMSELFDKADITALKNGLPDYTKYENELIFGIIEQINGSVLSLKVSEDESESWRDINVGSAQVLKYNLSKESFKPMWSADLAVGQLVLVRANKNVVTDIVIYE